MTTYFYNELGQLSRSDGPAVEPAIDDYYNYNRWYYNGKIDRVGGYAVGYTGNPPCWETLDEYWINDKYYSEEDYEKLMNVVRRAVYKFKSKLKCK